MTAEAIAKALGGRKAGAAWMAHCPAHDDREPSLSIRDSEDGKVLVHCHAGCEQADLIAVLRSRGLWDEKGYRRDRITRWRPRGPADGVPDSDSAKRVGAALAIWNAAEPTQGTPVETYLASHGLHLPPVSTLRFHAVLKHPSGGIWPVMVALVTTGPDGTPLAIHRDAGKPLASDDREVRHDR
jgi:putative DNA primase/helicase